MLKKRGNDEGCLPWLYTVSGNLENLMYSWTDVSCNSANVLLNTADHSNPSVASTSTGCLTCLKGGRMVAISGSSKLFPLASYSTRSVTGDEGGETGGWWEIGARCSPPTTTTLFVFLISILIGYRQFPFPIPNLLHCFSFSLYHIHPFLSPLPNEQNCSIIDEFVDSSPMTGHKPYHWYKYRDMSIAIYPTTLHCQELILFSEIAFVLVRASWGWVIPWHNATRRRSTRV